MKKWILIVLLAGSMGAFGQELMMPEIEDSDSLQVELNKDLMYRQLLSGSWFMNDLLPPLKLPSPDFNAALYSRLNPFRTDPVRGNFQPEEFSGIPFDRIGSPLFTNQTVFSSSAMKLNERFSVGGYSFGARSVFTAPLPARGINNFDVRGSTLFMQYKVSKNFKIETRVNVTQGPGPGF